MPNGMVIQNLDDTFFSRGYLYGTIDDTGETADGIAFGALQNISLQHAWGKAELRGPESMTPVGVAFSDETLNGSAGWGVILPSQLKMMFGGSVVHSGGRTTYTKKVNEEPSLFNLHLITDPGADELEVMLFGCIADNAPILEIGDTRAYVMRSLDFSVYGKRLGADVDATLFKVVHPGNKTASNVSQPGNTNSNDVPDVLEPDA